MSSVLIFASSSSFGVPFLTEFPGARDDLFQLRFKTLEIGPGHQGRPGAE